MPRSLPAIFLVSLVAASPLAHAQTSATSAAGPRGATGGGVSETNCNGPSAGAANTANPSYAGSNCAAAQPGEGTAAKPTRANGGPAAIGAPPNAATPDNKE